MKKNENIFNGRLKPALHLFFAVIFFLSIFFISYLFYQFTKKSTQEQLNKTANLTAHAVRFFLDGTKNELVYTSRQQQMLQLSTLDSLTDKINTLPYKVNLLVTAFEVEIVDFLKFIYDLNSTFIYLKNVPSAFNRLIIGILTMDLEGEHLDESPEESESYEEYKIPPDIISHIKNRATDYSRAMARNLSGLVGFVNYFSLFKQVGLADEELTNLLLARSLDTGNIKCIAVKNLEGQELASADLAGISIISSKDAKAIAKGKSAFDGGVVYGGVGKAFWWFALPIRNGNREPVACLSAFVDLSKLLPILELEPGLMRLSLVDEHGECIFTRKKILPPRAKTADWSIKTLNLSERFGAVYPNLQIIVELDVYKYLNHYYYECILSLLGIFLAVCYFLLGGVFGFKNSYNSEVRSA